MARGGPRKNHEGILRHQVGGRAAGQPLAIAASFAPVALTRSCGVSSISRPRRPALQNIVGCASAEESFHGACSIAKNPCETLTITNGCAYNSGSVP